MLSFIPRHPHVIPYPLSLYDTHMLSLIPIRHVINTRHPHTCLQGQIKNQLFYYNNSITPTHEHNTLQYQTCILFKTYNYSDNH